MFRNLTKNHLQISQTDIRGICRCTLIFSATPYIFYFEKRRPKQNTVTRLNRAFWPPKILGWLRHWSVWIWRHLFPVNLLQERSADNVNLTSSGVASSNVGGEGKCLTSDEKQYFVWHAASQKQKMNGVAKNLRGTWRPGYAYAYQHNVKMYWTAYTMLTSARTHHATSVLKQNVNNSPCNLKLWKSSCNFIIRKSTRHVQFETSRCNKHFEMKLLPTSFIPTLLVSTQTRIFRTFGCGEVFKRIFFIPFIVLL